MAQATYDQAILDRFFAAGEKSINCAFELSEINVNALKKLGEQHAQMAASLAHLGNQQYELMSSTRDPEAFFGLQTELGKTLREQVVSYVSNLQELGKEVGKSYYNMAQGLVEDGAKAVAA